jgi:hypothetical protein
MNDVQLANELRAVNGQALAEQAQQQKPGRYPDDALPVYRIALEESRIAFAELMAQPEKIRRNVGTMLGFAGVAVSIFGFARGRPDSLLGWIWQIGALAGLLGLVACAAYVTWPWKLIPSMEADKIIAWGDGGDTEADTVRNVALAIEANYQKNKTIIDRLFKAQLDAACFFGLAVLMLAITMLGA